MDLTRRGFLKLTATATAGVAAGCGGNQVGNLMEAAYEEDRVPNGVERWVTTGCNLCPGGCGVRVRLIDTRAVKLEGNSLHPVSGGGLCPVGQASLQLLYNPDRVRGPMKRAGERGAGRWHPISWEEGIRFVADRLRGLRERREAHTLLLLTGHSHGVMPDLLRRFAQAFGTPNVVTASDPDPSSHALWLTQGIRSPVAYDLENAKYILSFGVPLVDGWWDPVRQMRALVQVRQGTPGRRGKLVQIEPRLSPTAAKADEWIPVNPGTEGALVLGLAHVVLADGLFDRRFVTERTFGFEDWIDQSGVRHTGFRTLLIKEYTPSAVAKITGVSEETIRRLAREFAGFGPGVAIGPVGGQANTLQTALAIHALNALVGSIDRPGGALVARTAPRAEWPEMKRDAVALKGLAMPRVDGTEIRLPLAENGFSALPEAIKSGKPYRINALLLWGANPAFTEPNPHRFRQALSDIPFVVSFSSFLDESTQYADLVLPDHTFLEAWHDDPPPPGLPYPVIGMAQPAVEPIYDTRHTGDIFLALAREVGGSLGEAFPWKEFKELLKVRGEGLYRSQRGMTFTKHEETGPPRPLREWKWAPLPYESFEEFWEDLVKKGGWIDPSYRYGEWRRVFRTRSGKFEFHSQTLRRAVEAEARAQGKTAEQFLAALGMKVTDDRAFLPHYDSPRVAGDERSFPLTLVLFRLLTLGDGSWAHLPFLQERLAPHANVQWGSWAELNPETAKKLGVSDGDSVWVESGAGKVKIRARLSPGIMPEVVAIPLGQGHTALGRYARGNGVNPMALIGTGRDPLSGMQDLATRVKVSKA
ncbi:MAG: molybdopterin-dependent oxidoreductase [Candidatus Methylomirabilales bacterium]